MPEFDARANLLLSFLFMMKWLLGQFEKGTRPRRSLGGTRALVFGSRITSAGGLTRATRKQ